MDKIDFDLLRTKFPTIDGRGSNGKENVVVVMDTGVGTIGFTPVPLVGKILSTTIEAHPDFFNESTSGVETAPGPDTAYDDEGHGTAMASIIAGAPYTHNGIDYAGVAPGVKILPIKLLGAVAGGGFALPRPERIYDAFKWVLDRVNSSSTPYTIVSVNVSWGIYAYPPLTIYDDILADRSNQTIKSLVTQIKAKDVFVAQASGNSNTANVHQPAGDGDTFAVGSLDTTGDAIWQDWYTGRFLPNGMPIKDGTSWGTTADYIDVAAPGITAMPFKHATPTSSDYYTTFGHTSYATPHVAAAAALLKQVNPNFSVAQISDILINSATIQVPHSMPGAFSQHRLDLDNAVTGALRSTTLSTTDPLQPLGVRGTYNDIAYSSAGLHFVWWNESARVLMYALRPAGATTIPFNTPEIIDAGAAFGAIPASKAGVGAFVSLAVDHTGVPAVAYYDEESRDLRYIRKNGTSWGTPEIVHALNTTGYYPSLAFETVNSVSTPVISFFYENNADLFLAEKPGATWSVTPIDTSNNVAGRYSQLAVHPGASRLAVVYTDETDNTGKYRQMTGGIWSGATTIHTTGNDLQEVAYTALAFTSDYRPAVSFYITGAADLWFAESANVNGTTWTPNRIGGAAGIFGLNTNLRFLDFNGVNGAARWDIVLYNKTNSSVDRVSGHHLAWTHEIAYLGINGGGANVTADQPRQYVDHRVYPARRE